MLGTIAKSLFGSSNERYVRSMRKTVDQINALEEQIQALSDEELTAQTDKFREQLASGKTLDQILPEAFATVREASVRVLGMRHFDVQMIGGIVLHRGEISEMRTGEGKTLVATLATYLNALEGKGVHVVTVNDYLARRDAEWMGQLYRFLGLTVGVIVPDIDEFRAPRRLQRRHHLRHEQRVRFRLSARQHEARARPDGPAPVQLRHRRRGRFDPDRRGAHAADHFRPDRGQVRTLCSVDAIVQDLDRRMVRGRREVQEHHLDRGRHRRDRGQAGRGRPARDRQSLRCREHAGGPPSRPGDARATSCSSATRTTS